MRLDTTIVPKVLVAAAAAVVVACVAVFGIVPRVVGEVMNGRVAGPRADPSAEARRIHATLDVVDLHADALLWDRSLLRRGAWGHVDLPRLTEGRVAVEGFTVVTKTPRGMNLEANDDDSDLITLAAVLQRWPPRTWGSLLERALWQARRLADASARSDGRLTLITTADDLDRFLRARAGDASQVAGFLGLEGAHALEGRLENVDRLHRAGFRMFGLTHFFDNRIGGSAHGLEKGGLTPLGHEVLDRMDELGILVDLAHASPRLVDDVLARARRPVVVSHAGVRGTCDNARNLDDAQLRGVAATGGVVGVGLWETAVCGTTPDDWARAVRHVTDVVGVDHVALGSDWDGAVMAIVDGSGTVHLVQALLDAGFAEDETRAVMGGNAIRVLRQALQPTPAG